MDEVIADTLGEHIERYNEHFNEQITKADLTGKWLRDAVAADRHANLDAWLCEEDFFADLPLFPHAQRVLARLQQGHEVFIASAAMEVPTSFNAKYTWLKRHFPFIPDSHIVFCGDKGILRAEYLIDDNPRQLRRFQGEGILFSSPHNLLVTGFRRVDNWLDVERLFFNETTGEAAVSA
jgi:5'(3')-deoxyribonucleotidase